MAGRVILITTVRRARVRSGLTPIWSGGMVAGHSVGVVANGIHRFGQGGHHRDGFVHRHVLPRERDLLPLLRGPHARSVVPRGKVGL